MIVDNDFGSNQDYDNYNYRDDKHYIDNNDIDTNEEYVEKR